MERTLISVDPTASRTRREVLAVAWFLVAAAELASGQIAFVFPTLLVGWATVGWAGSSRRLVAIAGLATVLVVVALLAGSLRASVTAG